MKAKLENIQALRFIAASAVVVDHTLNQLVHAGALQQQWRQLGWFIGSVGVAAFFVISGFIMVHAERANFGRPDGAPAFALKRIVRIVPMYWLATFVQLAVLAATRVDQPSLGNLVSSMFFIPTPVATGETMQPVFSPGWTLNYEMMFYLIFFIAMFFSFYRGLLAILVCMTALFFVGAYLKPLSATFPPYTVAMFLTDPIILMFAIGCVIASLRNKFKTVEIDHSLPAALILLAAAVTLFAFGAYSIPMAFDGRALFAVFPIAAVAVCTFGKDRDSRSRRVLSALGDASYSTYLFHLFFIRAIFPIASHFLHFAGSAWVYLVFAVFGANVAGHLLHRYVERPLTAWLRDLFMGGARRRGSIAAVAD
jgi:peptidoglycan/LPS O-acetylase OafA/YrhL